MTDRLSPVVAAIEAALSQKDRVVVCIDGPAAAGKTTAAGLLASRFNAAVIPMDAFFLQPQQRTIERMREVGGNIDYERFRTEVSPRLNAGVSPEYGIYDCATGAISRRVQLPLRPVIIVEGVYSLSPALMLDRDLAVFMDVSRDKQIERLSRRCTPTKLHRFVNEWLPLEQAYFRGMDIRGKCSVIV